MEAIQLSSELTHYCTRCKADLKHRVTEMNGDKPKRVLCLTCQTARVYRAKPLPARRAAIGKAAATKAAQETEWRQRLQDSRQTPKVYDMDGIYKVNDVVKHASFGLGLTTELIPPNKMNIFFDEGLKLMKCGPVSS